MREQHADLPLSTLLARCTCSPTFPLPTLQMPVQPAGERDDLKALLVATLQRLESVDEVVRRADMANAVLEERVATMESERDKALAAAAAAQGRVDELLQAQRRIEWQNKVQAAMSNVMRLRVCLICGARCLIAASAAGCALCIALQEASHAYEMHQHVARIVMQLTLVFNGSHAPA